MATGGYMPKGSDNEDGFFFQQDQKLIEEQRRSLNAQRAEQERSAKKQTHWMKCPKCGHDMVEVTLEAVMVDQCQECRGVYFDSGERELMIKSQRPGPAFERLRNLFK